MHNARIYASDRVNASAFVYERAVINGRNSDKKKRSCFCPWRQHRELSCHVTFVVVVVVVELPQAPGDDPQKR